MTLPEDVIVGGLRRHGDALYLTDRKNRRILRIDLETKAITTLATLPPEAGTLADLAITKEGDLFVSAPPFQIWSIPSGDQPVLALEAFATGLTLSPDDRMLYTTSGAYDVTSERGLRRNYQPILMIPRTSDTLSYLGGMRTDPSGRPWIPRAGSRISLTYQHRVTQPTRHPARLHVISPTSK